MNSSKGGGGVKEWGGHNLLARSAKVEVEKIVVSIKLQQRDNGKGVGKLAGHSRVVQKNGEKLHWEHRDSETK